MTKGCYLCRPCGAPPTPALRPAPPSHECSKKDAAQLGQQLWQQLQAQRYLGQQAAALAEPLHEHEVAPGGLVFCSRLMFRLGMGFAPAKWGA